MKKAVIEAIRSGEFNGYTEAAGSLEARTAVAKRFSTSDCEVDPNHVFLTHGAYQALHSTIGVMVERGENILCPRPNFPYFKPIC